MIHTTELKLSGIQLRKIFDLPENASIVSIKESEIRDVYSFKIVSTDEFPEYELTIPDGDPKKVGDAFRNPEKYKAVNKGVVCGKDLKSEDE